MNQGLTRAFASVFDSVRGFLLKTVPENRARGLALIGLVIFTGVVAISPGKLVYDECHFVPNMVAFQRLGLSREFLVGMKNQAPGPLYQIVHAFFAPITKLRPPGIRFVSILFLVGTILVACETGRRLGHRSLGLCAGDVLAIPLMWKVSGLALTEAPAMFFCSAAILVSVLAQRSLRHSWGYFLLALAAGACFALAVIGRTTYLVAPGALVAYALSCRREWYFWLWCGLLAAAFLPLPLYVFSCWGGLVPPQQAFFHSSGIQLRNALFASGYAGVIALLLFPSWVRLDRRTLIVALGAFLFSLVANVTWFHVSFVPMAGCLRLLAVPSVVLAVCGTVFPCCLVVCAIIFGLSCLRTAIAERHNPDALFVLLVLCLVLGTTAKIAHSSTRYVVQVAPFLVLVAGRDEGLTWSKCLRNSVGMLLGLASLVSFMWG